MEPVVEVIHEREGVRYVVALGAEEQQHSQREVFSTTSHTKTKQKTPLIQVSTKRSRTRTNVIEPEVRFSRPSLPLSIYLSV